MQKFLNEGSPPVYVGFGSIGDSTTAYETTELVIKALQLSQQRGIIATGWNGMYKMEQLPENIFMLESVPHTWLFPHMAAIVHHGGAGTTAAGLNAGVPTIIIPHGNDQPAWGQRIFELGVGPKPIHRKELTAEALADAIKAAMHKDIRARAKELGDKIRNENGATEATRIIDRYLRQKENFYAKTNLSQSTGR